MDIRAAEFVYRLLRIPDQIEIMVFPPEKSGKNMPLLTIGILEFIDQGDQIPFAEELLQRASLLALQSGRQTGNQVVKPHIPLLQKPAAYFRSQLFGEFDAKSKQQRVDCRYKCGNLILRQGPVGQVGLFFYIAAYLGAIQLTGEFLPIEQMEVVRNPAPCPRKERGKGLIPRRETIAKWLLEMSLG